jgi:hypothetical protein
MQRILVNSPCTGGRAKGKQAQGDDKQQMQEEIKVEKESMVIQISTKRELKTNKSIENFM